MALTNKLSAIGDAIRAKTGKSDLLTLEQMPVEIAAIETGGSGEEYVLTGDCKYKFANSTIPTYSGSTIPNEVKAARQNLQELMSMVKRTEGITNATNMFHANTLITEIPFDINLVESGAGCAYLFSGVKGITTLPKVNGTATNVNNLLSGCNNLKDANGLKDLEITDSANRGYGFQNCYNLRSIPSEFLKRYGKGTATSNSYIPGYNPFYLCYLLDEVVDFGVTTATYTSAKFSNIAYYTFRLKKWTFETNEDGTPLTANWHTQTLDFSQYVGYVYQASSTFKDRCPDFYNLDTKITNDTTYASLKDNPDAWTELLAYSRYNHDSAVETINSLPDTSAYLAANSGKTNTIKFKGSAGSSTDGGAINTLTEEEIAVAAAKGWTVSLV